MHKYGKDEKVQSAEHLGQLPVVVRQSPKTRRTTAAALHRPSRGQHHEFFLRFEQPCDLRHDALFLRDLLRSLAGVALVCACQLDRLAHGLLHCCAQGVDLGALLFNRRRDMH